MTDPVTDATALSSAREHSPTPSPPPTCYRASYRNGPTCDMRGCSITSPVQYGCRTLPTTPFAGYGFEDKNDERK
jgi:hypothetical protein